MVTIKTGVRRYTGGHHRPHNAWTSHHVARKLLPELCISLSLRPFGLLYRVALLGLDGGIERDLFLLVKAVR